MFVSREMNGHVVRSAQPCNEQGTAVVTMMTFGWGSAADFARLANDLPAPNVDIQVRSRIVFKPLCGAEFMRAPPLAHVASVARKTVGAARCMRFKPAFGADDPRRGHGIDHTTETDEALNA